MKIKATLAPGQNGTKQLLEHYGDQLVCVRYRYDENRKKRLKTVELIINENDWEPGFRFPPDEQVFIRVNYGEMELRERVKSAGGYWDSSKKAWRVSYHWVLRAGLEKRIVDEFFQK